MSEEKTISQHPMDILLQNEKAVNIPKEGDLVTGAIISLSKNEIYLDIDGITTGIIRGREIYDESDETIILSANVYF